MLEPVGPSLFRDILEDAFAEIARRRGEIEAIGLSLEFDAKDGASHALEYAMGSPADSAHDLRLLKGLKVVEVCQIAAGPFAGMLLADYGAEVIKIEPPEGDAMRQWPPIREGLSENFASLNRGKSSIALDLKLPADRDRARALVLEADVVLENSRPGVMERLGVGPQWALAAKPSLVYCSISAFGQAGPRAQEGGFDVTIQAAAGVMSVTGEPGGAPVKCGVPISDFAAGLYAAMTILAMVHRVRAGGPGGQIDVPMFGTTLAIAALQTSQYFGTGVDPVAFGSAHPRNAPYQAFKAKDGYFVLAAGNERLWQQVCEMVGAPELAVHPLYNSTALRAQNQQSLQQLLESYFTLQPSAHWLARCRELGIPSSPIQSYSGALADPQARHYGLVRPLPMPGGGQSKTVGCPIWIDGQAVEVSTAIPPLSSSSPSSPPSKPLAPSTQKGTDPQ